LRGSMLALAKDWYEARPGDLSIAEQTFIQASIDAEEKLGKISLQNAERLRDAEAKAEQERVAAGRLQVELAKLKELYKKTGVNPIGSKDETIVEVIEDHTTTTGTIEPTEGGVEEVMVTPVADARADQQGAAAPIWAVTAVGAERSQCTGKGTVVAIFGTGIDAAHPAFGGVTLVQKDFTGSGNGDRNGHSTHTAGTVFGRDVDNQRFGIAPGVTKALIAKVLDDSGAGQESSILQGVQWVLEQGADVICIPMGFDHSRSVIHAIDTGTERTVAISNGLRTYLQLLRVYERFSVAATSRGRGAVIIAPAGNDSQRSARVPMTSPLSVAQGVISVGAVELTRGGRYAVSDFSNSFPTLCAPGADVVSAYPGGSLRAMSGTSMACASAAGVAALWWEYLRNSNPGSEVTSQMVTERILKSVETKMFAHRVQNIERGAGLIQSPP
jgi:subtilisin family serine protease